jgi:hypothetical protein
MKKITLLFCLLAVSFGYAQTDVIENFDGDAPTIVAEGGCTPGTVAVTDELTPGDNSLKIITSAAGSPWQGTELVLQGGQSLDLTTNKTIFVDVYSEFPAGILAKVTVGGDFGTSGADHPGGGWETLEFNLDDESDGAGVANGIYTNLIFYPLWGVGGGYSGQDGSGECNTPNPNTIYIDNIIGTSGLGAETCFDGVQNQDETGVDCGGSNCDACPSPPAAPAPAPPERNAWDVISLYSDAYADVASNFDAGWCGANSVEEVMIGGNATLAWKSNACQGIVLNAGVDASAFNTVAGTNLHVDLYIQAGTDVTSKVFNLKFVQQPGGAALEINLNAASTPALVAGSWLSIDVPVDLTTFTGFKEFGVTSANLNNIAWYDNLYVYRDATVLSTEDFETSEFRAFPNPTNGDWNISGNSVINNIAVYDILGKQVIALAPNATEAVIDASSLNSGIYFARIESINGSKTVKLIKE